MRIGIAGPILTAPLSKFLDGAVNNPPQGLGGTSVIPLVKGLLKKGYRVSVYTLDKKVTKPKILRGKLLTIYYGPYRPQHRMRDLMRLERKSIRDFITADKPDLVHAHWTYEFALGSLASRKPTLVTVRDWAPVILFLKPDAYRLGRLMMHYQTITKARHFTAVSPYIQRYLAKYKKKKYPVIPNTIDDDLFSVKKRHLNTENPKIVSINNAFSEAKNVSTLLKAFKLIRKKIPNCTLSLIGNEFGQMGKAWSWTERNGLAEGILFLGPKDNASVLKYLEQTDLSIHCSLEESFGMAVLEAMCKKTPVIGGDKSGAVPWLLNFGQAGVLTDVRSPEAISRDAVKLLTDSESWQEYAESGYRHAFENFRLSRIVDRYLAEYKRLLQVN